jgi:hypothetical protein
MWDTEYAREFEIDTAFSEIQEMEYAANLLEITDEGELDQFLGGLIKRAGQAAGGALEPPVGRALGGYLKAAVRQVLPSIEAGAAGVAAGRGLATPSGQVLGLELEGLSAEDQEFEIARRLVRLIGAATQKAAQVAPGVDGQSAAKQAVLASARTHAPGLVRAQTDGEIESEADIPFGEVEELELAAELMEVSDEGELDQFIGNLLRKAGRAAGALLKTPIGRQIGGLVKGAIKKALPSVGAAIGNDFPPAVDSAIGPREDQEFEVARRFVRLASTAARHAASTHPGADIRATVIAAVKEALQQQRGQLTGDAASPAGAAGIEELEAMAATPRSGSAGRSRSGRWIRRGGKIVLLGV